MKAIVSLLAGAAMLLAAGGAQAELVVTDKTYRDFDGTSGYVSFDVTTRWKGQTRSETKVTGFTLGEDGFGFLRFVDQADCNCGNIRAFANGPHVFNLGHGITPDASVENVHLMIDTVRGG